MDTCVCCGAPLEYEGTLICWECARFGPPEKRKEE